MNVARYRNTCLPGEWCCHYGDIVRDALQPWRARGEVEARLMRSPFAPCPCTERGGGVDVARGPQKTVADKVLQHSAQELLSFQR